MSAEQFHKSNFVKNAHCANCTIGCEKILVTSDKARRQKDAWSTRALLRWVRWLVLRTATLSYAHRLSAMSLAWITISVGATIAWAMECFERGILTTDDTTALTCTSAVEMNSSNVCGSSPNAELSATCLRKAAEARRS